MHFYLHLICIWSSTKTQQNTKIAELTDGNRNATAWMDFYAKLRRKAIYAVVVNKKKETNNFQFVKQTVMIFILKVKRNAS